MYRLKKKEGYNSFTKYITTLENCAYIYLPNYIYIYIYIFFYLFIYLFIHILPFRFKIANCTAKIRNRKLQGTDNADE